MNPALSTAVDDNVPMESSARPGGMPARKQRFSGWWFLLPVGLILASIIAFVGLVAVGVGFGLGTEASFPADGTPHRVSVPTDADQQLAAAGDGRLITCRAADRQTGREVDFEVFWGFDPGSGDIEATCISEPPGATVEVSRDTRVDLIYWALGAGGVLGLTGCAVFLGQIIVYASRPPRVPRSAGPAGT